MAIVVVIIPVAVAVPPMFMFIPPAMAAVPAPLSCFVQLLAPAIGLPARGAMMFDRFMQPVIGTRHSPLAIIVIGAQLGRPGEKQASRQSNGGEKQSFEQLAPACEMNFHSLSLLNPPWLGWGTLRLVKHDPGEKVAESC
jgi:hypothetical protein